ncbi:lysozyme C-1-like [Engraulis encrasicolus]|uniref:lysozyme C-1-like n=1 Tax=Engraulis encrasicolus TaxID=184585 RepID=UPI002FD0091E
MRGLVFLLLVAAASAKVYQRCELATILNDAGMDGYRGTTLADWICLIKWESNYNSSAISGNFDGSTDYGLFQLNSRWWCDDGKTPLSRNGCHVNCTVLLTDNIRPAIVCAKRVVRDYTWLRSWSGWRNYCMGRDLSSYIAGCKL